MAPMTQKITLAKGLNVGLRKAMEDDPKVLLMGEDVGKLGGVFRITDGLQKDFGEDRVIDTPAGRVRHRRHGGRHGAARLPAGRARSSSTASSTRRTTRSSARSRRCTSARQGKVADADGHPDPVRRRHRRGRAPQRVARRRSSRTRPGLKVVACSNPVDGYWMIQQAIACDDPVIFLEPKRQYHADKAELDETATPDPLFTSRVVRAGHATSRVLAYGPTVKTALQGRRGGRRRGQVARGHRPAHAVAARHGPGLDSVRRTGRAVVTHEAHVNLGMGAEVAARITEQCFYSLEAPVLRVGGFDTPYPPSRIEEDYLPDLDRVLDAVDRSLDF